MNRHTPVTHAMTVNAWMAIDARELPCSDADRPKSVGMCENASIGHKLNYFLIRSLQNAMYKKKQVRVSSLDKSILTGHRIRVWEAASGNRYLNQGRQQGKHLSAP